RRPKRFWANIRRTTKESYVTFYFDASSRKFTLRIVRFLANNHHPIVELQPDFSLANLTADRMRIFKKFTT
ncbi:MAG TPA: hypothetical protein VM260_15900, partial [Pirellula sp.]|nr:hypothetical protein [Pirellula sp.]